jgi:hypothetical protein
MKKGVVILGLIALGMVFLLNSCSSEITGEPIRKIQREPVRQMPVVTPGDSDPTTSSLSVPWHPPSYPPVKTVVCGCDRRNIRNPGTPCLGHGGY